MGRCASLPARKDDFAEDFGLGPCHPWMFADEDLLYDSSLLARNRGG